MVVSQPQHARSSHRRSGERPPEWWPAPPPTGARPSPGELVVWAWFTAWWVLFEGVRRAPRVGAVAVVLLLLLLPLGLPPMAP